MVDTPTSFIVGAGASRCYGLPLGSALLKRAKALEPSAPAYQLARRHRSIPEERLTEIIANIKRFPGPSIDDYLQKRQSFDDIQAVGRTLIAAFMGDAIVRELSLRPQDAALDWLKSIFLQMSEGADTFEEFVSGNHVSFVTFNFDSVIQTRLEGLAIDAYGPIDTALLARAVPVFHVHGRLPSPPAAPLGFEPDTSGREPASEWLDWIPRGAESVKVVFDDIDEPTVEAARDALAQSRVLCFLGFSFHPDNIARLDLGRRPSIEDRALFGTTLGMSDGKRKQAARRLHHASPSVQLDATNAACRAYLEAADIYL